MYGTIARCRLKPNMESHLIELVREFEAAKVVGAITSYIYRMDADTNEYYVAVIFTSKATYFANANSPEQDRRYKKMLALLESPPEWHDGQIICMTKGAQPIPA